ncbi:MAG: adenylate kinase [Candidatus Margulisbacteria bacterium]|nr:adenylate kinase [Candidatus Margulisiibacteriota bacterium]
MILIFLGPPGSGKGTQAKLLAEKLKIAHISLGDLLREEVRIGSVIGKQAKAMMDAGKLVPDELTIELAQNRIKKDDCRRGFIMDGFPRSAAQADAFDKMLAQNKLTLGAAVYFAVDEEPLVKRLLLRAQLEGRADDTESVIRTRFEVYAKQTAPLIEHYKKIGKLVEIDAARPIDQVTKELFALEAIASVL